MSTEGRAAAEAVLEKLEEAGFQAYLVGGCVRDLLLGKPPADYDVATNALPDQVQSLFPRTAATGLKHGTVAVLCGKQPVEVTTFRKEGIYRDRRRPERVEFVPSLETDLARRDFTINAMAQDRHGRIVDPFGGREDLDRKQIRAVGDPEQRFAEDALRMLRAIRFASQLQFSIHPDTRSAIRSMHRHLRYLSVERVTAEMEKIWSAPRPSCGLRVWFRYRLHQDLPPFDRWPQPPEGIGKALRALDASRFREARWAIWLGLYRIPPSSAASRLRELRLPSRDIAHIQAVYAAACTWPPALSEKEGKQMILNLGPDGCLQALDAARWTAGLDRHDWSFLSAAFRRWAEEMPVRRLQDLAIDGHDLIRTVGRPPGPWVGQVLQQLFSRTALGELPNDRERLLEEGCRIGNADS